MSESISDKDLLATQAEMIDAKNRQMRTMLAKQMKYKDQIKDLKSENASLKERVDMSTEQLLKLLFDEGLLKIDFDQALNPSQNTFEKWMDDYGEGFLHDLTNNQQSNEQGL